MQNLKIYSFVFSLFLYVTAYCQVQVDHQLQFTGSGSDAEITGIQAVSNNQDATNVDVIQKGGLIYASDAGSVNAFAVTLAPAITTYTLGMMINFKAANANTGVSTLNINGLGVKTIKKLVTTDLAANDIRVNQLVSAMYDGTNFQMLSQLGNSSASVITHYIGELFGGGIVVSVWDSSGTQHGLIADTSGDLSAGIVWSSINSSIGATAESPIDGVTNTNAINTQSTSSAAHLCLAYNSSSNNGGFTDWYLPAVWEIQECFLAAMVVNRVIGATKGFNFIDGQDNYWSSTEEPANNFAWFWQNPFGPSYGQKNNLYRVRAVRRY